MTGRLDSRSNALSGAFFFLVLFQLFVLTHAPSLYLDDSGETVTVAALLGIGHPPGYPLHSLLGNLWLRLPVEGLPGRLNLFASFCAAGSAALLFVWLRRRGAHWAAAATAAGLYAVGPVFWHNALGAKGSIYQLNNLISAGLLALLAWDDTISLRRLRAFWLLLGLGLAHHYMSQLPLLPVYAWLLWKQKPWRGAWLLLLGPTLYAYIFLRSAQQPGLNWGGVHSWKDFWFFFFRLQYSAAEGTRSAAGSGQQLWHALKLLWREGFYVLLPAALAAAWLMRKNRLAQALFIGWLAGLASVSLYLNLKVERLDLMKPYLFPVYLCQAGLVGLWLGNIKRAWLGMILPVGAAAMTFNAVNLGEYFYAQDNARNILRVLPANALLFAQGDAIIFPLWYAQRVQGLRPDVAVVGNAVLPMDWVRDDLKHRYPDVLQPRVTGPVGSESVNRIIQALAELNENRRPLFTAYNKLEGSLPGWALASEGPVYRLHREGTPATGQPAPHLQASVIRGYTRRPLDERTRTLIVGDFAIHYNSQGVILEEAGKPAEALAWYQKARRLYPEGPEYPFNEGNAYNAMGRKDLALEAYERAVAVDPTYVSAWYNLGVTYYQSGRRGPSVEAFKRVLLLDPSRQDVRQLLAQIGA
jgi:tetratricopeptide (TPR) repeat protein